MKGNNFEQIKNRMIDRAAILWGVAATDIESSFDPVVSLLISTCAMEIEKISNEVDESKVRVTERLIQLMTPDSVYGPNPAKGIIHIEPIDDRITLKTDSLFYFKKKITVKNTVSSKNLFFSPVIDFNLVKASVKYVVSGNNINELVDKKRKETIAQTPNVLAPNCLYIGVDSSISKLDLSEIPLYFEPSSLENTELFYQGLQNASWEIESGVLKVYNGFQNEETEELNNLNFIHEKESNLSNTVCNLAINFYGKRYVTINDKKAKNITSSTFPEIKRFLEESNAKIEGNIRWVKIVFPSSLSNQMIENIYCSINSFPVLNRELNSFSYRINEFLNILPVKTPDLFLDIKSIVNTSNQAYKDQSVKQNAVSKGTFVIRKDNIGKLDQRKAGEYLKMLIEILKDESASFSLYNNDFLHSNLKELNQLISSLEKKVLETTSTNEETVYAILKPFKKKENLLVEFWTTNGKLANNLKVGGNIDVYKAIGVKHGSGYLVTTTQDGKDNLTMSERLNAYRSSLLTRDKIVTKEDIKVLCLEIFDDKVNNVTVKRGFLNSISENKGLIQCVEINLFASNNYRLSNIEWDALKSNLLFYLEKKSLNIFPYKINIVI